MSDWPQHSPINADGLARIAISSKDPGIQNWLDTVGNSYGVCQLRFYKSPEMPVPTAVKMPVADLHKALPADTAKISPDARRAAIRRRTRAIMLRYNF